MRISELTRYLIYRMEEIFVRKKLCEFHENNEVLMCTKKKLCELRSHAQSPTWTILHPQTPLAYTVRTYEERGTSGNVCLPDQCLCLLGRNPWRFVLTGSFYALTDLHFISCQSIGFFCYWPKIAVYRHFDFQRELVSSCFLITSTTLT